MTSLNTRFQDLITVTTSNPGPQRPELWLDVGAYAAVVVQCRKPVAGGGAITLTTSATRDEAAFVQVGSTFSLSSSTTERQVITGHLRYLRWVTAVSGTCQFMLDVVARQQSQPPGYFAFQPLTTVTAAGTQPAELWLDLGAYRTALLQVRVAAAAGTGTLTFETAASMDDVSFVNAGSQVLTSTGNFLVSVTPMRYLRWRIATLTGSPQFQVDVVAREHA